MQDPSRKRGDLAARVRQLEGEVDALRRRLSAAGRDEDSALLQMLLDDIRERRRVEAELARAREWIELAQAAAGVCAYEYDIKTLRLTWSASTAELYGLASSQRPSIRSWRNAVHPDDRAKAAATAALATETGRHIHQTYRIVRPDGEVRWIEDRGRVLCDEDGQPRRVIGLNIDVTDLTVARQAAAFARRLRKLLKLLPMLGGDPDALRALLDCFPVGIMISDLSSRQVYMNGALHRMWGGGEPIQNEEDWAKYQAWDAATGEPLDPGDWPILRAIRTGRAQETVELCFRRFDSGVGHMLVTATPLAGPGGKVAWGVAVAQDITDRRAAEARAHLRDELLRRVGEAIPDLIFVKDRESRLIYANRALLGAIGKGWDEVAGRSDAEWRADPAEAEALMEVDRRVMRTGRTELVEEAYAGASGQRTYLASNTPLRDRSGDIVGVIVVATDISERKRIEAQTKLLAREMRHRMKNTLATVHAMARHSFGRGAAEPRALADFEDRLVGLAEAHDLLGEEAWTSADVGEVVERTLQPHLGARITVAGPHAALEARTALGLSMALNELCTNAAKYGALSTPDGDVEIRWRLEEETVRLAWTERDGPPVRAPERSGFGTRLMRLALAHDPLGRIEIDFAPEGLRAALTLSVAAADGQSTMRSGGIA